MTDAEGRYQLDDVVGDWVAVVVRSLGYGATTVWVDLRASTAGATVVAETIVLRRGASVDGRIESVDGEAVEGVGVYLAPAEPEEETAVDAPRSPLKDGYGARVETDARGQFRFRELGPGTWVARLVTPNRAVLHESIELEVGEHAKDVVWVLPCGGTLSGRVSGADGTPLEGAHVSLSSMPGQDIGAPFTATDGLGQFRFEGAVEGSYQLRVSMPGGGDASYVTFVQEHVVPDGRFIDVKLKRKE